MASFTWMDRLFHAFENGEYVMVYFLIVTYNSTVSDHCG